VHESHGQNHHHHWEFRFRETRAVDFYLIDPRTTKRIFVKGSSSNVIKLSEVNAESNTGFNASLWQHEQIPPHLQVKNRIFFS